MGIITFKFLTENEKKEKRIKRAYQRFLLGTDLPGTYRLVTLSTPDSYHGDFHNDWTKLVRRMSRRGIPKHYFAVKEFNKKRTCKHLHVAMRLKWIDFLLLRQQWNVITGAVWIHVDNITTNRHMARYLSKYLTKSAEDFPGLRSYWYSYEWIYRKFATFSKDMWRYGRPLDLAMHKLFHDINDLASRVVLMNSELLNAFNLAHASPEFPIISLIQYPIPV